MSNIQEQFLPESVRNRKDLDIRAGDTVRVNVKIQEKGKTRIQAFEGLVLARKHGAENGGTFTVRKVSNGIGVERIFPLYSPAIDSIEILRRAKVRQSKLYFLRDVVSKTLRYKLRRITDMGTGTADLPEWDSGEPEVAAEDMMDEEVIEETQKTPSTKDGTPVSEEVATDTAPESEIKEEETSEEVVEEDSSEEKEA
ncbi:50S ribosomal protein L19 [Patescibacteria group bacterium]|nr:50S ribosomal protein L19 [Patescibacteria group bacterium]